MKLLFFVILALVAIVYGGKDQILHPKNSDEMLDHLQGNNYNIYILFFPSVNTYEEVARENNKELEDGLEKILSDNPEIFFATIDHTNPKFNQLLQTLGVHDAPSVFLMVHGKGVWIYEGEARLVLNRLKEFLPEYKEASSHKEDPYE